MVRRVFSDRYVSEFASFYQRTTAGLTENVTFCKDSKEMRS